MSTMDDINKADRAVIEAKRNLRRLNVCLDGDKHTRFGVDNDTVEVPTEVLPQIQEILGDFYQDQLDKCKKVLLKAAHEFELTAE